MIFTIGTARIFALHKLPETPSWQAFTVIGTGAVVAFALVVTSLPLAIVAHGWRIGRGRDRHMSNQLSAVLSKCRNTNGGPVEVIIPEIIAGLDDYKGFVIVLSPNAFYLLADEWQPMIEPRLEQSEMRQRLEAVAQTAPAFRAALASHKGPLHWVLPDPRDEEVRVLMEERAQSLALDPARVVEANRDALRWLQGDLTSRRAKEGGKTHIHLCGFVPKFRLLLTEMECVFQKFPEGDYGFMSPIHRVRKEQHFFSYASAQLALTSWCGIG